MLPVVSESGAWKILITAVWAGTAVVVRGLIVRGWERRSGGGPPSNTADDDTTWREAVIFAIVSGIALGIARIVSDRAAAEAWRRVRGSYPPGIKRGRRAPVEAGNRKLALARQ